MPTSTVLLPEPIEPPYEVYVNGVLQQEDSDYVMTDDTLVFSRVLANEGNLGFWRWCLGAFGIGTYRAHDSVDVRCRVNGKPRVLEGLRAQRAPSETDAQ